jgi:hypothetical protein
MRYRAECAVITGALILCFAGGALIRPEEAVQWDFRTYYYAAVVSSQGGNPYDLGSLSRAAGEAVTLPYLYPPYALHAFRPFLGVDLATGACIFLCLKLAALALLLALWWRSFLQGWAPALFLFVCAFGYNASIYRDVAAGNVSIFEQLFIWIGLLGYLRQRYRLFCLLIAVSALFKGASLLLLLLLLLHPDRRRRLRPVLVSIAAFLAFQSVAYLQSPDLYREFLLQAARCDERGITNPSSLAFFRETAAVLTRETGFRLPGLEWALYSAWVGGLAALSWVWLRRRCRGLAGPDAIAFGLLLYALVVPRFKDYSFILLLVPSLHVIRAALGSPRARAAALVALCAGATSLLAGARALLGAIGPGPVLPPGRTLLAAAEFLLAYQSLYVAAILFCLYLRHLRWAAVPSTGAPPAPPALCLATPDRR